MFRNKQIIYLRKKFKNKSLDLAVLIIFATHGYSPPELITDCSDHGSLVCLSVGLLIGVSQIIAAGHL